MYTLPLPTILSNKLVELLSNVVASVSIIVYVRVVPRSLDITSIYAFDANITLLPKYSPGVWYGLTIICISANIFMPAAA